MFEWKAHLNQHYIDADNGYPAGKVNSVVVADLGQGDQEFYQVTATDGYKVCLVGHSENFDVAQKMAEDIATNGLKARTAFGDSWPSNFQVGS